VNIARGKKKKIKEVLLLLFFSLFLSSEKTFNCLNHFFCEKGRDLSIVRVLETQFLCLLEKNVVVC
jgi:hypothetical protein